MTKPNGALRAILLLAGAAVTVFCALWALTAASIDDKASGDEVAAVRATVSETREHVREMEAYHERDIREQGHWPISDRTLAEAISALLEAGAQVIGLDLYRDLAL